MNIDVRATPPVMSELPLKVCLRACVCVCVSACARAVRARACVCVCACVSVRLVHMRWQAFYVIAPENTLRVSNNGRTLTVDGTGFAGTAPPRLHGPFPLAQSHLQSISVLPSPTFTLRSHLHAASPTFSLGVRYA